MDLWPRRKFFLPSLAGSALAGANKLFGQAKSHAAEGRQPPVRYTDYVIAPRGMPAQGKRPLIISSANGVRALDKGMDTLKKGGDTLEAVVTAVTVVEDDPNEDSVCSGGLPTADGRVGLAAS